VEVRGRNPFLPDNNFAKRLLVTGQFLDFPRDFRFRG
jgi:hypothetical protein